MERHVGLTRVGFKPPAERIAEVIVLNGGGLVLPFPPRTQINPVSKRRARENRQRTAMADRHWPDRREGTVMCTRPGCDRLADDLHEPLSRARGGSIVDPENSAPLCRPCHDEVTFKPESELGWAYGAGLLKHSWHDNGGDDAA